ncbi:histidine kinase/DNA gyrase B/HSP90-like ATPase [Chitinophaga dinghuensis]|uniref:Histidine kinase/DNA gyrase B/HSP90-like ATPase n=1 Tax=Chitinophaga dinghuensis TaxID=1539050 RepID=A0A327W499_9BACT|nr:ATP-binding protein [Chitinophaga dinghuensis]RAJ83612.1 histidine kinase/DNA gyrase B/HSP90-like ATPase [Chitinophaga dinghuensis]
MLDNFNTQDEVDATPNPEFLIKSIAEQGYTLETALADLIDNAVSKGADKIEILIDTNKEPFVLYLADNGIGMTDDVLRKSMHFPSTSSEYVRAPDDLGRFGLGMKTASFSQTRQLTVLSRSRISSDAPFSSYSWNVDLFAKNQGWKIHKNQQKIINEKLDQYLLLSKGFLNNFDNYAPSTIIIWDGLYKFENYLEKDRKPALQKEITEITSEYLSLVFHRFLERSEKKIKIRINNHLLIPFNPFPEVQTNLRKLERMEKIFKTDTISVEGFILPSSSIQESKDGNPIWTPANKSLMDMEGIYVYRGDRLIIYGGWLGVIKKAPRMQLARLKVDIGNSVDKYFQLNVAKSLITIPYELQFPFVRYISNLKKNAENEYSNRGTKSSSKLNTFGEVFLVKTQTSKSIRYEVNENFHLLTVLKQQLTQDQFQLLRVIMRMLLTTINALRNSYEHPDYSWVEEDIVEQENIAAIILTLKHAGLTSKQIKSLIITSMDIREDNLPPDILKQIN